MFGEPDLFDIGKNEWIPSKQDIFEIRNYNFNPSDPNRKKII